MTPARVVIHHKRSSQCFIFIPINSTLILSQFFPPLGIFIMDAQNRFVHRFPFMCRRNISFRPCQSDIKRGFYSFVTRSFTTDISHPMATFISLKLIASTPFHIRQCRKSATLIAVPFSIPIRKNPSQSAPFEQIITFCYPRFVTTTIGSTFTVVNHISHQPLVSLAKNGRTINLMIIVCRGNCKPVFVWCLYFLINLLHSFLRNFPLRIQRESGGYTKNCQQ